MRSDASTSKDSLDLPFHLGGLDHDIYAACRRFIAIHVFYGYDSFVGGRLQQLEDPPEVDRTLFDRLYPFARSCLANVNMSGVGVQRFDFGLRIPRIDKVRIVQSKPETRHLLADPESVLRMFGHRRLTCFDIEIQPGVVGDSHQYPQLLRGQSKRLAWAQLSVDHARNQHDAGTPDFAGKPGQTRE